MLIFSDPSSSEKESFFIDFIDFIESHISFVESFIVKSSVSMYNIYVKKRKSSKNDERKEFL